VSFVSIGRYVAGTSVLHRLDPRTKLAAATDRPYADYQVADGTKTETIATWRPDITGLVDAFVASARANQPPPITGEDGVAALAIMLAAYRSSAEGRPISLK